MTDAFLKPTVLTSESEGLIREAFSAASRKKVKAFEKSTRKTLRRTAKSKLSAKDLKI